MKKRFIYLLLCSMTSLFSCENTDYQRYDKNQKDKLFFARDTIRFTYGLNQDLDVDLSVGVNLIGCVNLEQDEPFKIEIVEERTTAQQGEHFTLPKEYMMEKDTAMTSIPLDFHKLKLEKNKDYALVLRLVENEHFAPADVKECVILFSNKDVKVPGWWRSDKLGEYNQEKLVLFVHYYHLSKEKSPVIYKIIYSRWGENLDRSPETNLLTMYRYQGYLNRYILTPMYEDYVKNNDPMYQIPNPNN